MHCLSSRLTSWLTRTLSIGGVVVRLGIGASVIGPSRPGRPTQHQRRTQETIAIPRSQPIPRDRHREIKGKFCTIVGGVISPLLANIYLHYVFDLWAERWRRREATGDMIIVRYADDIVVGFQHEADGQRFLSMMRDRLQEFALQLHPDKTRLIEFGRYAAQTRQRKGLGKPETFNFLGFTHICGKTRQGRFQILRKSRRDRRMAKLKEIKNELRRRMHRPIPEQGRWLKQVLTGYYAYHAVPTNYRSLGAFRDHIIRLWAQTLRRRSQRHRLVWERMIRLANDWLPRPRILHPRPRIRFAVKHPR